MPEGDNKELQDIIILLKQLVKGQEKLGNTLDEVLNLFKKYEIDEVLYSESLRED